MSTKPAKPVSKEDVERHLIEEAEEHLRRAALALRSTTEAALAMRAEALHLDVHNELYRRGAR